MRRQLHLLKTVVLTALSIFIIGNVNAQVTSGNHTVGSGGDFPTLAEVRDTLVKSGIAGDGHVYFDILDGTYDWGGTTIDVVLTNVDASNTITIQSQSLDASKVTLESSTAYQLFNFTDCDYITVQHLTLKNNNNGSYARAFYLGKYASNITIKHNVYWGFGSTTTDSDYSFIYMYYSGGDFDNLVVDSNIVNDGSYLAWVSTSMSAISSGCRFRGNTVNSFGGLTLDSFDGVEISGNTFTFSNTATAINLITCDLSLNISNNHINSTYTYASQGIKLNTCIASGGSPSLIYNNSITLDGGTDDTRTGLRLDNSEHQHFFHNSVYLDEANNTSYAIFAEGGANIWLKNNNLVVEQGGYALGCSVKDPNIFVESDYNNFYCEGNYLANWEGIELNELSNLKAVSLLDLNSISVYPNFYSSTNLKPKTHYLDNTANNVGIATDIDGNARTEFDIGAYEYEPANTTVYNINLTINPAGGGDFVTLTEAIDSLVKLGVSAPITVELADGTYTGLNQIRPIPGVSATNTVTFQSASADASLVKIEYSSLASTDNYVLYINNSDYLTFNNLTFANKGSNFARIILFNANAHDITFQNCIFNGTGVGENTNDRTIISCYSDDLNNFTATDNIFNNGSRGIYFTGTSTTDYTTGLNISNNDFNGQRSNVYIKYFNNFDLINNSCNNFNYSALKVVDCNSPYTLKNNKISTTLEAESGIHLYACIGNAQDALIYNNFIHIDTDVEVKAIYCDRSEYQNFYYNSVNVISSHGNSTGFYHYVYSLDERGLICKNNIFNNEGPGYAFSTWWATATIIDMNYNNFYSLGSNILYWRVGTSDYRYYSNVDDYFAESGFGEMSQSFNPVFTSESDLHVNSYWLDNKGISLTGTVDIDFDIDGDSRDATNPDMGADEYVATLMPYEGEYTVGAGGYFDSFTEAIDSLKERGMLDTVYLSALNGAVNEQFKIPPLSGLGSTAELFIQSQSGNASDVIFSFDPGSTNNYLISIDNADYITVRNLTFSPSTSQNARAIVFNGKTENLSIYNNIFDGRTTSSTGGEDAIIYAYENSPVFHNLTIRDNIFNDGSRAIYLRNANGEYALQVKIHDNIINTHYQGIELHYTTSPTINNNTISYDVDNGVGINLQYAVSGVGTSMSLVGNRISSDTYSSSIGGVYIRYCDASSSNRALIANNTIRLGSNGLTRSIGFYLSDSDFLNLFYNSVNITNNNVDDIALYSTASNDITLKNNIFAIRGDLNTNLRGNGYAIYFNNGNNISSNFNNLYTSGRYIANWQGTNYSSIDDYKAISSQDANSVNIFPAFIDNNMQTQSFFMNASGTPLTEMTEDINAASRDALNPDLGAFEYSDAVTPMSANSYVVGAGGDIPSFDSLMNALYGLGIQGSKVFNVQAGSYTNTFLVFKKIPGSNSNDTVIIQSENGNPEDVSLIYTQGLNTNFIVFINGAENLTLKDLSFVSGGTSYSRVLYFNGYSNNINIINNRLVGSNSTTTESTSRTSLYVENNHIVNNLNVLNNTFLNNSFGIYFYGWNYSNEDIIIDSNIFDGQFKGIYAYRTNSFKVKNNTFSNFGNSGVLLDECDGDLLVMGNNISTTYDNVNGIYIKNSDGNPGAYGLIANNFVLVDGTGSAAYGIRLETSYYQKVYHNTVNITGTHTGSNSFRCWNGESNKITNNIFIANLGYAYVRSGVAPIETSDFNSMYTNGTNIALDYQTNYTTLADFKAAASNTDASSVNILPTFLSENNLHIVGLELMELGSPITYSDVPYDIDGEMRDATIPDIGADELYARAPTAESHVICEGDDTPTLSATGINVKWYSDEALNTLLWSANEYSPTVTAAGTYVYYVTETISADESDPTIVTLKINSVPDVNGVIVNIDCEGNDYGGVNLTVTGDSKPFFYRWSNEATSEDITNLLPGKYYVTVEDIIGCTSQDSFNITAPDSIFLSMILNDANCGVNNGNATVVATGGNSPFEYRWTTGDSVPVVDSLESGIYVVNVTDQNGCTQSAIATVNDLGGSTITVDAANDVSCYGGSDGSIAISITGGVTPYTTSWSNTAVTEDVSGLVAGPYEISVTDGDGCRSLKSILVNQPNPILIGLGVFDSNCDQLSGSATTNVKGGIAPYSYKWNTGSTEMDISSLGLGVYSVTVTDGNSCEAQKSFAVSEIGAPVVYIDSIIEGTCGNSDGAIYITSYGGSGTTLDYLWSTNSTEEDLVGINPGEYSVNVTDSVGCSGAAVAEIMAEKPETPAICIVTVDTATNNNEVVWEKPITNEIDHYNIYRESTQSNVYLKIGEHSYNSESIFVDKNSNALQRSYRYKISSVNVCGVESDLSPHHKTMHLTINIGDNGLRNLIWDHYEGFNILTYYIHRYTPESGWVLYDSIQSNLTSFVDSDTPLNVSYYIEIINPNGCVATKSKVTNKNSSRSNVKSSTSDPVQSDASNITSFTLAEQIGDAIINTDDATVLIRVTDGTDVTSLVPSITISDGASINPLSGVSQDFTNPVIYTVTAESGAVKEWTVTVSSLQASDAAEVLTFVFTEQTEAATINSGEATVSIIVIDGTDLSSLVPNITISDAASINPLSGVSQDFTNPVVYTVTSESGVAKAWTVSVQKESSAFYSVTFNIMSGSGAVGGAEVNFSGNIQYSDVDGVTVFVDQQVGSDLPFTVAKSNFNDYTGSVDIINDNLVVDVLLTPIGVIGEISNSLRIYPNPNNGKFYLNLVVNNKSDINYKIYDKHGKLVISNSLHNRVGEINEEINLNSCAKGVYFIQILTDDTLNYMKIIVQ